MKIIFIQCSILVALYSERYKNQKFPHAVHEVTRMTSQFAAQNTPFLLCNVFFFNANICIVLYLQPQKRFSVVSSSFQNSCELKEIYNVVSIGKSQDSEFLVCNPDKLSVQLQQLFLSSKISFQRRRKILLPREICRELYLSVKSLLPSCPWLNIYLVQDKNIIILVLRQMLICDY